MINLTQLLPVLSKYKHVIGYTVTALVIGLSAWYGVATLKDHHYQNIITQKEQQIAQLNQKVTAGDIAVAKIDTQLTAANAETAANKAKAVAAQKKVDILIAKYEHTNTNSQTNIPDVSPDLPDLKTLDECKAQVATMQTDMTTLFTEIKEDRALISSLEIENKLYIDKNTLVTTQNSELRQIADNQNTIINNKDKQLDVEKSKTTFWKRVATVAGAVIAGALLL